ncbi:GntR family transcriptional regulator [Weeksellaceae bacterium A-14]
MKLIHIDKESAVPIYRQITESIEEAILNRKLFRNDRLPSVNKICMEHQISRDTVFLAYERLKQKGIVKAIPAKGYYVRTEDFSYDKRYFVLFDELNSFKEDLLTGFMEPLSKKVQVDTFFHHFNLGMFRKLILDNIGNYSKYIIMPGNVAGVEESIAKLPVQDVYIIDQMRDSLRQYSGIYQNFVKDIFHALESSLEILEKYNDFILIFPGQKEPVDMVKGFGKFCSVYQKKHRVIPDLKNFRFKKGQMFLIPNDRQLVETVEKCKARDLKIGSDIGIVSYNETPLKKVVENGITTLSTDFTAMGRRLAQMVLKDEIKQIENPARLYLRSSL